MEKDKIISEFQKLVKRCSFLFASQIEPLAEEYGLSFPESQTLMFFYDNPEFDCAAEMVKMKGVSKGFASNMVSALASKDLIEIQRDEIDRRVQHIILTEKAMSVVEKIHCARLSFLNEMLSGVTEEEFAFAECTFAKVMANAENIAKK